MITLHNTSTSVHAHIHTECVYVQCLDKSFFLLKICFSFLLIRIMDHFLNPFVNNGTDEDKSLCRILLMQTKGWRGVNVSTFCADSGYDGTGIQWKENFESTFSEICEIGR